MKTATVTNQPPEMDKYTSLHKWMIIPMVFMQLGICYDYWGDFSNAAWSVHIHYWSGTLWYLFLIFQPYYATHNQLERHRTNGIIGMFLAGGVCITALSMLYRDIETTERAIANPENFGPFEPWFFFGIAVVEIFMMAAFAYAIIKSIQKRKSLEDHAWWLITTVFIIMMPALGRGIQNVYVGIHSADWPDIAMMRPVYFTQVLIIAMILGAAWKYKKLKHPGTYVAIAVNAFVFFLEPLGRSIAVQEFLKAMIKG